jgi:hypothetical protein
MYTQETRLNGWLPLIALLSIVILVWFWWPTPFAAPSVSPWRPQPLPGQPELPQPADRILTPNPIVGSGQALAGFDAEVDAGLYAGQRDGLTSELDQALGYVSTRFGSGLSGRIKVVVAQTADCGLHGIAYTDVRTVQVFTCNDIAQPRAVAILAHEFVHQLEQDRYGPDHLHSDMILSEGAATWGAGSYWLGGKSDFRSYVREQRQAGVYYPLATNYSSLGIGAMNALYYEWASFVEFLVGHYGRAKFDQVYVTGHSDPGSSDYRGVYGKDLGALEQEWLAWLGE